MRVEITEAVWLDERAALSLDELAELSGLPVALLQELMELDVLSPVDAGAADPTFSAECLALARAACRLRADFDLDTGGLAVAMTLLERIDELERRLRALQAQFPHHRR